MVSAQRYDKQCSPVPKKPTRPDHHNILRLFRRSIEHFVCRSIFVNGLLCILFQVQLWDVCGNKIGTFGQEMHWKIEPYSETLLVDIEKTEVNKLNLHLFDLRDLQKDPDQYRMYIHV